MSSSMPSRARLATSLAIHTLLTIGFAASIFADDPPPPDEPYIASENDDLDGDEINDTVLASPEGTTSQPRGEVEIRSGSNGQLLVTIRGQTDGDKFGYSVAIVQDTNLDTHKDIIIGAPKDDEGGPTGTPIGRA